MRHDTQLDVGELLCPIPWWWIDLVHPHRRLDDLIRDAHIPVLHGDYVPPRDDPRPPPLGVEVALAVRRHIAVATSLAAAESEVERGYAMIRSLSTQEGAQRFTSINGLTAQPLEPGEQPRGPRWRRPIQKLIAAELFAASLATVDTDFAQLLRATADAAADLALQETP
ncbi:hypothetical protein ACXPWS_11565 [Mycobacterium sp. BMJ-28]